MRGGRRRRAATLALFAVLTASLAPLAAASFGAPESQGLLHLRSARAVGLGTLSADFNHGYYYQDVGIGSRYHGFLGRVGLAFGLGEIGQIGLGARAHGTLRFASVLDQELVQAIGESDFEGGLGDSDFSVRFLLPLPSSRLRFGVEAAGRLPTGDQSKRLSVDSNDYEFLAILSVDLLRGTRFVPTKLHLNFGQRINRNPDGYGLPPTLGPAGWSTPYPPFYPALEPGEISNVVRQNLYGAGLEFVGNRMTLFGELSLDHFFNLEDRIALRENPWQLALGFRMRGPWRSRLFGAFDMNVSSDDFETAFEPHYPRLTTTFGMTWHFQVLAGDPDGDGIRGDADECPGRAEDFDGFEDDDGCPDLDNDGDGVPDLLDLAPLLPEDFDGFEDEDGRPDLDNDNDGIPDRDDLCPDRAEDYDGFQDEDGCPDRFDPEPAPKPGLGPDVGGTGEPGGAGQTPEP